MAGIKAITGSDIAASVQTNVGSPTVNIFGPLSRLFDALGGDLRSPLEKINSNTYLAGTYSAASATAARQGAALQNVTNERLEAIRGQEATANAQRITDSASERIGISQAVATSDAASAARIDAAVRFAGTSQVAAVTTAKDAIAAATRKAGADTAAETAGVRAAVNAKKLNVDVKVVNNNKVSVQQIVKQTVKINQYTTLS